jgi:hypothetical protein
MRHPPKTDALKTRLLQLGYPWPENLDDKGVEWLETEIEAIKPMDDKSNDRSPHTS